MTNGLTIATRRLLVAMPVLHVHYEEFNASISELEKRLALIGPGVSAWHTIAITGQDIQKVGYAKLKGKWCLALQSSTGEQETMTWRYCEAPCMVAACCCGAPSFVVQHRSATL